MSEELKEREVQKPKRGRRKKVKESKKYAIPDDEQVKKDMIEKFIVENVNDEEKYEICPFIND